MTQGASYAAAGVDVQAGERAVELMRAAIATAGRPEVVGDFGGFAGLFDISAAKGMSRPLLATSTDGVGTKIDIARRMNIHDTVGIDLVAMVVDDLVVCGAEPLFMTDYIAVGKVDPARVASIVTGVAAGCAQAGCALAGGETAEHPGLLAPDGFSLARHIVFSVARMDVQDHVPELGRTLGEELLTPTRIYARDLLTLMAAIPTHSISHITGGGIAANVARVMPEWSALEIDRSSWSPAPVFDFLMARGDVALAEAEHTFNMGIGMVAFVPGDQADAAINLLAVRGLTAWQLGVVRQRHADETGDAPAKGGAGGAVTLVGDYRR